VRYVLTRDADEFAKRTERLLSERLECNVLATVLTDVLAGSYRDDRPLFAYGLGEGDQVRFAALRTPPWPLLTSPLEGGGAEEFTGPWLEADPEVSAVSGVPSTARAIAAAWATLTGGTTRCRLSEAMHALEEVVDPARPAPGRLRPAHASERDLFVGWMREFGNEADLGPDDQAAVLVDASLRRQELMVWEDGAPVSMLVSNPCVAGVVRIGLVYTPPAHRRRGYATSAVAAASRAALADGARRCMLYTDVSNPTSNKIYAEIGYRRCGEWEVIEFDRGR
jgi:GNAT superfamily N-acetyltransferase